MDEAVEVGHRQAAREGWRGVMENGGFQAPELAV